MASENAKQVAKRVLESIGKGEKINLGKIARESGYADNTADNPKLITSTKTYQEETKSIVDQLETERQRCLKAMKTKDLDKVTYDKMMDVIDKLTKNIQLLTGGDTERIKINQTDVELKIKNLYGRPTEAKIKNLSESS